MGNLTKILGGKFIRTTEKSLPPEQQFINKIENSGLEAPVEIIADGLIHRFNSGTGTSRERTGYYALHAMPGGDFCAGIFGEWKLGIEEKFISHTDREITAIEKMKISKHMEESKRLRDEEKTKQYEVNADAVQHIWDNATIAASNHPYLEKKGINSHGAKVTGDGRLVLPLYTAEGTLASLQYIGNEKRFHAGSKTSGCFHMLGNPESPIAYLAEGFADAATIVEETGCPCYIAYSGSNMAKVAQTIKDFVSNGENTEIVVISDNDSHGKGQEYAQKAAEIIGARVIIPPSEGDINDYRANGGDVKALLMESREDHQREINDWLMPADEFCSQPAPISWLVKGWIQDKALVMVHGPSGGGKTFLVLDMALRIASGIPDWNGHKVKEGNVFYLAGEGHHGLRSRFAGWKQENHADSMNLWISKTGLDLDKIEGYEKTSMAIRSTGKKPALIIVDTLHRFLGGDENSAQDAKLMLDSCSALMAEFDCTVLLVHHTGVSDAAKERARGSSAWRGALDIEISITPGDKQKPMEIKQMKSKDAELQEPKFFTLDSVRIDGWFDEDGEQVTTAILSSSEAPASKKEVKELNKMKVIEEAWIASGKGKLEGRPVVSRSAIVDYLVNTGRTESSANQEVKPSAKGKLINTLIKENKIKKEGELYIVVDKVSLSIFSILGAR